MTKSAGRGLAALWRVAILAVVAMLAGCAPGDGEATPADAAAAAELDDGRRVYVQYCAACHGSDGQGGVGPKLAEGEVVERYPDRAAHRQVVVDGRGQMPAWGGVLSDDDIDAVVRYEREGL